MEVDSQLPNETDGLQKSKKPSSTNGEIENLLTEQLEEIRRQKAENDQQQQMKKSAKTTEGKF